MKQHNFISRTAQLIAAAALLTSPAYADMKHSHSGTEERARHGNVHGD
jgi:hypothetical protein